MSSSTESFKLISLVISGHGVLGEVNLNFTDREEFNEGPYTTVIIGPNGTGKSYILRTIINIFREIEILKYNRKKQDLAECTYKIKYYLNGSVYYCTNSKRNLLITPQGLASQILKNNKPIELSEIELPTTIIASSIMVNDRFPAVSNDESIYEYIGVRRLKTPSIAGTQTFTRRIVDLILDNVENTFFISHLEKVLDLINYEKELKLSFYPRYRNKIFTGQLTDKYLYDFFVNCGRRFSKIAILLLMGIHIF